MTSFPKAAQVQKTMNHGHEVCADLAQKFVQFNGT